METSKQQQQPQQQQPQQQEHVQHSSMDTAAGAHDESAYEDGITCPAHTPTLLPPNPERYCHSAITGPLHGQISTRWGEANVGDTTTTPPLAAEGLGIPASSPGPPPRAGPLVSKHPSQKEFSDRSPGACGSCVNLFSFSRPTVAYMYHGYVPVCILALNGLFQVINKNERLGNGLLGRHTAVNTGLSGEKIRTPGPHLPSSLARGFFLTLS